MIMMVHYHTSPPSNIKILGEVCEGCDMYISFSLLKIGRLNNPLYIDSYSPYSLIAHPYYNFLKKTSYSKDFKIFSYIKFF